jgi:hypothetical protein
MPFTPLLDSLPFPLMCVTLPLMCVTHGIIWLLLHRVLLRRPGGANSCSCRLPDPNCVPSGAGLWPACGGRLLESRALCEQGLRPSTGWECAVSSRQRMFCGERRHEADGSLRLVDEARIADGRACQMRPLCQWHGKDARHPRRVSLLLHPLQIGASALLWQDWSCRQHRRLPRVASGISTQE